MYTQGVEAGQGGQLAASSNVNSTISNYNSRLGS